MNWFEKIKNYFINDTIESSVTNLYFRNNINNFRYKVMTKDNYIEYMLNKREAETINKNTVSCIIERWNKVSKGYNFVIAAGNCNSSMIYSVDYFNEHIVGMGIPKKKDVKLKDLQPFLTAERVNLYIEAGKAIEYEIWGYERELSEYRKYKDIEGDTMFLRYGDYNVEEIGTDGENTIYIGISIK